ncbi:hypothetical protein ES703_115570 [subsurface metagenome]
MRQEELTQEIEALAEQSYDQLDGEWRDWLEVARKYERKVPYQDRGDMRHTIIVELHRARLRDGEPIPLLRAYRIASLMVALYWRKAKRIPTMLSLDIGSLFYFGFLVTLGSLPNCGFLRLRGSLYFPGLLKPAGSLFTIGLLLRYGSLFYHGLLSKYGSSIGHLPRVNIRIVPQLVNSIRFSYR